MSYPAYKISVAHAMHEILTHLSSINKSIPSDIKITHSYLLPLILKF